MKSLQAMTDFFTFCRRLVECIKNESAVDSPEFFIYYFYSKDMEDMKLLLRVVWRIGEMSCVIFDLTAASVFPFCR